MAGNTLYGVAVLVEREALGAQRNTLIKFYIIANDTGFAYYDTRAVVYCKIVAYLRTRVDIYTRFAMCNLGDDTGDKWHAQFQQAVRHAVVAHSFYAGVATDYLAKACGGRVAVVCSLHILCKGCTQRGQILDERESHLPCRCRSYSNIGTAVAVTYSRTNLLAQYFIQAVYVHTGFICKGVMLLHRVAKVTGEQDGTYNTHRLGQHAPRGHGLAVATMVEHILGTAAVQ